MHASTTKLQSDLASVASTVQMGTMGGENGPTTLGAAAGRKGAPYRKEALKSGPSIRFARKLHRG